jgi:hypothetical protein
MIAMVVVTVIGDDDANPLAETTAQVFQRHLPQILLWRRRFLWPPQPQAV